MPREIGDYICTDVCLGRGASGIVYQGYSKLDNQPVAVKVVPLNIDKLHLKYLAQEREILRKLDHPNIVKLYQEYEVDNYLYLFMELMLGGELFKLIYDKRGLAEPMARKFMCQLASGLKYLHDQGIVHRDLKPHNLLLTVKSENSTLKIADFGFARSTSDLMQTRLGSPLYMAPELLLMNGSKSYSSKTDMWSVGVIFWEMLTGRRPWAEAGDNEATLHHLVYKKQLALPSNISLAARSLLSQLLEKDPNKRLSWEGLCGCKYVQPASVAASIIDNNETWLQEVISFERGTSQSLYVTPNLLVGDFKHKLCRTLQFSRSTNLFLLDPMGSELQNHLTLGHYQLHLKSKILYCVKKKTLWALVDTDENAFVFRLSKIGGIKRTILEEREESSGSLQCLRKSYQLINDYENTLSMNVEIIRKELARIYTLVISTCFPQQKAWKVICSYVYSQRNSTLNECMNLKNEIDTLKSRIMDLKEKVPICLNTVNNTNISELVPHDLKAHYLSEIVDVDEILHELKKLCDEYKYLEDLEVTFDRLREKKVFIEDHMDLAINELPLGSFNTAYKSLKQTKKTIENINQEFHDAWVGSLCRETIQAKISRGKELESYETEQSFAYLEKCETIYFRFMEQLKNYHISMNNCIRSKQDIYNCFHRALNTTINERTEFHNFYHSIQVIIKPKFIELNETSLSLSKVLLLPKCYEQSVLETKRRRQWIGNMTQQVFLLKSHFNKLIKDEFEERKRFLLQLDTSCTRNLESIFKWLFPSSRQSSNDPIFAQVDMELKSFENLPYVSTNSLPIPTSSDLSQESSENIIPPIDINHLPIPYYSERDHEAILTQYKSLPCPFIKKSEASIREELASASKKLTTVSLEKEQDNLKTIESPKNQLNLVLHQENALLKAQGEELSKLKLANEKIKQDLKDAENLINQLLQDRYAK